jgi:CxxC motif-containing protein (DUF1111 family)
VTDSVQIRIRRRRKLQLAILSAGAMALALWAYPEGSIIREPVADAATVEQGRILFEHEWQPGDPLAKGGGDGLGPLFNANSCATCHFKGGVGGAGERKNVVNAYFIHPTIRSSEVIEGVVHAFATADNYCESNSLVREIHPIVPGGQRVVRGCTTTIEDFDPVRFEPVDSPMLFGLGLIDQIASSQIKQERFWQNASQLQHEMDLAFADGGVGRFRVLDDGRVGKFGWKGQFATLQEFVVHACANEIGLSTPVVAQPTRMGMSPADVVKPDLTPDQVEAMVAFVRTLPRPMQILPDDPHARDVAARGEAAFHSVGCASCHSPDLGGVDGIYSDLMLHRLVNDRDQSYGFQQGPEVPWPDDHPLPDEWRTPPLWGVADSAPYFHDGASATLESAIGRHSGEAAGVLKRYSELASEDQAAIVAFLRTLKAPPTAAPAHKFVSNPGVTIATSAR